MNEAKQATTAKSKIVYNVILAGALGLSAALGFSLFSKNSLIDQNLQMLTSEMSVLKTKVAGNETKILSLNQELVLAKNMIANQKTALSTIKPNKPASKAHRNQRKSRKNISKHTRPKKKHTTAASPISTVKGRTYIRSAYKKKRLGKDLGKVLKTALVSPRTLKDGSAGFAFRKINRGSLFEKLGFQKGDVILEANRNKIADPAAALLLFQQLRTLKNFQVQIRRQQSQIPKKSDTNKIKLMTSVPFEMVSRIEDSK